MNTSGDAQFSASAQPSAVHLPIDLLIRILIHAEELDSIVVGGQALNIWGERYFDRARDELAAFTPFQSKDIDFFGDVHDAEKLAHMLEGNLKLPSRDNFVTPSTAMIDIKVQNQHHVVDFLHAVAGIDARVMRERAMTLGIALEHEGRPRQTEILLLHPIEKPAERHSTAVRDGVVRASRNGNAVAWINRSNRVNQASQLSIIGARMAARLVVIWSGPRASKRRRLA